MYVYIDRIWRWMTYKGLYAIKPKQPTMLRKMMIRYHINWTWLGSCIMFGIDWDNVFTNFFTMNTEILLRFCFIFLMIADVFKNYIHCDCDILDENWVQMNLFCRVAKKQINKELDIHINNNWLGLFIIIYTIVKMMQFTEMLKLM